MPATDWKRRVGVVCAVMNLGLTVGGCASGSEQGLAPRTISVQEFSKPAASAVAAADSRPATAAATQPTLGARGPDVRDDEPFPGSEPAATPSNESARSMLPSAAAAPPSTLRRGEQLRQSGDRIVVDSIIGQVSGQPIYADRFLEPIAARLRKIGEESRPGEFSQQAAALIIEQLRQIVLSNLFLAEAEASLSPEQQLGLLAFMRRLRQTMISQNEGLEVLAESRSQQEGRSLQEAVEQRRDMALIYKQMQEKIEPRVIVAWKDVEREYQRRYSEFNPPASVTISRLRLTNTTEQDKQRVEQVKSQIAAGENFKTIAESFGPPAAGSLGEKTMGPGGISDIEVNEKYKPALAKVTVGQTTEPIDMGDGSIVWLHIDKVDQPQGKTLFEVQRQLLQELKARRDAEEREKYIKALFERGIYDDLREMGQRALLVARMRYER